ncbi:MAG: dipeptidyl peptidase 3, partial [Bacteroidia bacterium]|nr:dipeptidyl peptidase 3 [Bacteroidia bacterium]
ACQNRPSDTPTEPQAEFQVLADQFADLQVLRYRIPGFENLTLQQKELLYYLSQAARSGHDMIWDQNYRHNLLIRKTIENIVEHYEGERKDPRWEQFMVYAKRVWFSNGIHHHYSTRKLIPEFDTAYWNALIQGCPKATFPVTPSCSNPAQLAAFLQPILFDPKIDAKRVNQESGIDLVQGSANNFYSGVTQKEVEAYYKPLKNPADTTPVWFGLNSRLTKVNGKVTEIPWKSGGLYGEAIDRIRFWLQKAITVAENPKQKKALELLVEYYKTGDLKTWDAYNIAWVQDTESMIDVVNGFIEVYGDPLGMRASYESVVSFRDMEATKRIKAIGDQAQWFEDQSPILAEHKKAKVTGISAKVITVVQEAGDASPSTPIGINLPNADWIRKMHGSKSVALGNIVYAYNEMGAKGSSIQEFAWDQAEIDRSKKFGPLAGDLHTDLHEVIGHASGQLNPGIGTPKETLKQYASTLEEARADLVALYYIMDPKLIELGVMPSLEVGKAEYDGYIRNGLMLQLRRLEPGENLEESHMRNRQLNAAWAYQKGLANKVIERKQRDGKTYFVVNDYNALRDLFGQLLREIQRIKSEGDFKAGQALVETYGVKVEQALVAEVKKRFESIQSKPYSGFIQPRLVPIMVQGKIKDVKVKYPDNFVEQMMEFGREYATLPVVN